MISVSTNISEVMQQVQIGIDQLQNPDVLLRNLASTLTGVIRFRVHTDGQDSLGSQIGIYSPGYMKVRTGVYGNSSRVSRGARKGDTKDSGVYTKGGHKGEARPIYNRTADKKVIGSLTRQMENDMATCEADPIKTETGYGIGYKNPFNFQKSQWLEETYEKKIWALTPFELQLVQDISEKFAANAFNK